MRSSFLSRLTPGGRRLWIGTFLLLALLFDAFRSGGSGLTDQAGPSRHQPRFFPFDGGESAVYQASWSGIPVASAKIEAAPLSIDGKRFYEVKVQARTWKYLELIWKMQDSIESVFEARTLQPHRFVFRQRENRKRTDTTALFDPSTQTWRVQRQKGKKLRHFEFVSQDTLDPISATYLARSLDFKVGDTLRMEVFGGRSRYLVTLAVVGKERIATKLGVFDAYKIIPRVTNISRSGYAGRVREATAWISADEKRRPLKMVSQVFIGSVSIEMVEERGRG